MPRRRKLQATKKDWRWYAHMGLNVFVVLSMILGTVLLFAGNPLQQRAVFPTEFPAADIPTLAPTVGAPLTPPAAISTLPAQTPVPTPTARP